MSKSLKQNLIILSVVGVILIGAFYNLKTPKANALGADIRRVFVTSGYWWGGSLGGLTGADTKCQNSATAAGLGGTWKAWLSSTSTSAASRMSQSNDKYIKLNGVTIANSWADLTDGSILSPINVTELLTAPVSSAVWTNTNISGGIKGPDLGTDCNDWSLNTGMNHGFMAFYTATTSAWTDQNVANTCDSFSFSLYCFEQSSTVVVPGAPTGVTAVAGNAQATVSFTAPASNGGVGITSYTVTSSPGNITASGAASPITVTGLTIGTPYTFTVTATNVVGTGPASGASNSITSSPKRIFMTSVTYQAGSIGGISGADSKCTTLASNAGLGGTWKAWLSSGATDVTDVRDRMDHSTAGYVNMVGDKVANSWADLVDGTLNLPIKYNESGGTGGGVMVWTGTNSDGTHYFSQDCSDTGAGWTSSVGTGGDAGLIGITTSAAAGWTNSGSASCNSYLHLYCVEQPTPVNIVSLTGYAWSENIGWIDFAPLNGGVVVDASGYLSGYAWSENIGWIKFGGFSAPYPTGSSTLSQNAQIVLATNKLVGWARACGGMYDGLLNQTTPNDSCSGTTRTDGWDGWISLGGFGSDGSSYGINLVNSKNFTGYAYGSSVVGWIDFNPVNGGVQLTPTIITPINIYNFSALPLNVYKNGSTTVSWTSDGANSCTLMKNESGLITSLGSVPTSGSITIQNIATTTVYSVECVNYGNSANKSTTVNLTTLPKPAPKLRIRPSQVAWEDTTAGDTCTVYKNGAAWKTGISGDIVSDDIVEGDTYTLTCTSPDGTIVSDGPYDSFPPAVYSTCTPSQGGSSEIYANRTTTWTMALSTSSVTVTGTEWSGTDNGLSDIFNKVVSGTDLTMNHLYRTVGIKYIDATTTGLYPDGKTTFVTTCSTSTFIKLDAGTNGEL